MNAAIVPIVPAIELKRILYATDFSEASRAALPIVAAIARHYGSRVYSAHVWSPPTYPMLSPEVVSVLDRRQQREAQDKLERLLHTPALAAETILAHARHSNADLIGLGVRCATDIAQHFRQTVAYRILAEAECPVLTHHAVNRW
jgi:nucleotide-binding universal stress UspA family protein